MSHSISAGTESCESVLSFQNLNLKEEHRLTIRYKESVIYVTVPRNSTLENIKKETYNVLKTIESMPPDSKNFRFYYIPHCSECAKHINANTGEPLSLETTMYPIINFCDSQLHLLISYTDNINLYVMLPSSKRIKIEMNPSDSIYF